MRDGCAILAQEGRHRLMLYIDGGATHHLVNHDKYFTSSVEMNPPRRIRETNKRFMFATRIGVVHMVIKGPNGKEKVLTLKDVFFSPAASVCLYSVSAGAKQFGWGSYMDDERGVLMDKDTGQIEVEGEAMEALYGISRHIAQRSKFTALTAQEELDEELWHK